MPRTALVIGASSGIGLAFARRLVDRGWTVIGLARRPSPLASERYTHVLGDVTASDYRATLARALEGHALDVCLYATGIGHELDLAAPSHETATFATNLLGLVATAEVVLPRMVAARAGHFLGLSSQADRLIDDRAPSYAASKAGVSSYLEGLAFACRPHGVAVTNVRFGFVDTAMSSTAEVRPFLISAERAAQIVERALVRRPIRVTRPLRMAAVLWLVRWNRRIRIWLS